MLTDKNFLEDFDLVEQVEDKVAEVLSGGLEASLDEMSSELVKPQPIPLDEVPLGVAEPQPTPSGGGSWGVAKPGWITMWVSHLNRFVSCPSDQRCICDCGGLWCWRCERSSGASKGSHKYH